MSDQNFSFLELLASQSSEEIALPRETLLNDVSALLSDPSALIRCCGSDPDRLGTAAWRLCDSSRSDCLRFLSDDALPLETRLVLTGQLKNLFSELFDPHCVPVLYKSLAPDQQLNMACALFWDIAPLGPQTARDAGIAQACADVMAFQLTLANPACRESALLGAEQWIDVKPELTRRALQTYDIGSESVDELRKFALSLI